MAIHIISPILLRICLSGDSLNVQTPASTNAARQYVSVNPLMSRFPKRPHLLSLREIFDAEASEMFSHVFCLFIL